MKIRVVGHDGESQFPFGTSGPWCEFRDALISHGHEICSDDFGIRSDALISHRHSEAAIREADDNKVPLSRRALVLWEPQIVEKERYSREVLEQYGLIYAPSPIWAKKVSGKSFNWPQDKVSAIEMKNSWLLREKKFVIIQGNKFSARKGELYSLRRKVIRTLAEKIVLFGTNWNKGIVFDWWHWSRSAMNSNLSEISLKSIIGIGRNYKNYKGITSSKRETLLNYRYAIVIENSADFVSEKLFDCISAGCLVIYTGPPLKEFGINGSKLVIGPNDKTEIVKKCLEILELSDNEQYLLAKQQNASLLEISNDWQNTHVLRSLAVSIIKDMN